MEQAPFYCLFQCCDFYMEKRIYSPPCFFNLEKGKYVEWLLFRNSCDQTITKMYKDLHLFKKIYIDINAVIYFLEMWNKKINCISEQETDNEQRITFTNWCNELHFNDASWKRNRWFMIQMYLISKLFIFFL